MLDNLAAGMAEKGMRITYSDELVEHIAKESFSDKFGARNMRRFIERNVEDLIANTIIEAYPNKLIGAHLDVKENQITIKTI